MSPPTARPLRPLHRLKKWALRLLVLASVAAVLYFFRAPLLRTAGGGLVVDEGMQPGDVALLFGADRGAEHVARWYREGSTQRVLVLEGPPGRLERLGIVDSAGEQARKALKRQSVPEGGLTIVASPGGGAWNRARGLRDWLEANPEARVALLCDRFNSRRLRFVFRRVLGDELAGRVHWCAVPSRGFDETNWWHNTAGRRACVDGYLRLAHVYFDGENQQGEQEWDPDQYEQTLAHQP
jgi:hypothetical protein